MIREPVAIVRVLIASWTCCFDTTNGASVAHRALAGALAEQGCVVEVLSGSARLHDREFRPGERPGAVAIEDWAGAVFELGVGGTTAQVPPHCRLLDRGVPTTWYQPDPPADTTDWERGTAELLHLFDAILQRFRPNVLVGSGGDAFMLEAFTRARQRGIETVFTLHNFHYQGHRPFDDVDAIIVASKYSAEYHEDFLGLDCTVLPNFVNDSYVADAQQIYLTFVNPSIEKGVYPFARIADELGKRRPDIPILVVESRGTEATVAGCGLELRTHGTVHFMAHTADPRDFWGVTKVCLLPSVWWENQPLVAVEAMVNGIPVIGSDRGGIPETLGNAGIVLPIPDRITQATRLLPTAEEVEPWVQAVIRLWDDADFYQEHRRRALREAMRWDPSVVGPRYVEFFENLQPGFRSERVIPLGRARSVVLVPYLTQIEPECEDSLRKLEAEGVRVVRSGGNSAIDVARNLLASDALHDGFESIFFIDADIGFDPLDALRLLARPEPVIAGIYAKKGRREFASSFADGVREVVFGAGAFGLYPLKYAATGFLRIKASVLRRLIAELNLPHCNTHWGRGKWPFFQPLVVPRGDGQAHYLGEDWAFSHRLGQIGVTSMADTSIRLWHFGRYAYGWEDAGTDARRYGTFTYAWDGKPRDDERTSA